MILSINDSPLNNKRFRATIKLENGNKRFIDFGYKKGQIFGKTYIDGATPTERENYWARHTKNKIEKTLIDGLILSPATLSAFLLWGPFRNIHANKSYLNYLLKK
jgi:hypothetical protein